MAEAAAARREARRRKILENSHNRLQLISGKIDNGCSKESPIKAVISDNEIPIVPNSTSSIPSLNNGVLIAEQETFEFSSPNHDIDAAGDGEIVNGLAALISPAPEPAQPSIWEKLILYRYDMVLLSLLIQILHGFSLITFDGTYFFLPVILYVVTKFIWLPTQNNSVMANAFLLLNGISADKVQKIMYFAHCMGVISQDVCVFLFITICIQSLYITLKDNLIT